MCMCASGKVTLSRKMYSKMTCFKLVVFLVVFGVTFCQDIDEYEDYAEENGRREIRQYNQDDWRPARVAQQENWSPDVEPQETDVVFKRRRLRKRKRRPPVSDDFFYPERPLRRRVRPQRLDEFREPWEEMEADAISRPNVRRRVTPVYQPSEENVEEEERNRGAENELAKTPVVVETENVSTQPQMSSVSDLKKLLKNTGSNISLSELLQQKNLSLSELLNGSEKAISALTEKPQQVTESIEIAAATESEHSHKYTRQPPSIALKKTTDRNFEAEGDSVESLSAKETMEAQRKRLAVLGAKENKLYSSLVKFDVVTEATTERRIFVPAHPKYYTSLNFKPNFNERPVEHASTVTTSTSTTTSPSTTVSVKTVKTTEALPTAKKKGYLPMTNAKLKQATKVVKEEPNFPFSFNFPKPATISLNEIFGLSEANADTEESEKAADTEEAGEPFRMPIDIEASVENNKDQTRPSTELPGDNETLVTAREEIMEIMKDPSARDSLSRILEIRNMTLQELVEQRERGSSQRHLADIFHNKTREPEPKEEPFIGRISAEYFNGFKPHERKQKSLEVRRERIETSTVARPADPVTMKMEIVTAAPTEPPQISEEEPAVNSLTFPWRQLYPDLFSDPLQSEKLESMETIIDEEDRHLEDSESGYISSTNERFDTEDVFLNIPSGVKSALFVSLAIIGLSLVVFIAILVILRCLQKKTRASNYCSSLSSRMRSPMILQGRSTAALKTFMNETLGRKKNYFRSSMQSMSDEIWDTSKERKPSF